MPSFEPASEDDPPIPAATLVLVRACGQARSEILMVERAAKMVFAGGALVFPGGRVDPQDHDLPAELAGDPLFDLADRAARIAAIRETIEEAGIAVGVDPAPDAAAIGRIREGLLSGAPFAPLLHAERLTLSLDRLTPFARWCPNFREHRRFDTRFYVAAAPEHADVSVDGGENVHAAWITAETALADADAGRCKVIFPTRRTLERLAACGSYEAVVRNALDHSVELITPWVEERDGQKWLCIPGDRGYPVTSELLTSVSRA